MNLLIDILLINPNILVDLAYVSFKLIEALNYNVIHFGNMLSQKLVLIF